MPIYSGQYTPRTIYPRITSLSQRLGATSMTKQYKPFDLAAAKAGAKLITRDGRAVIHFHHIETDTSSLSCVVQIAGNSSAGWIQSNGRCLGCHEDSSDLFIAPVERTVYVNLWIGPAHAQLGTFTDGAKAAQHYDDEAEAKRAGSYGAEKSPHCLALAVPITITE